MTHSYITMRLIIMLIKSDIPLGIGFFFEINDNLSPNKRYKPSLDLFWDSLVHVCM